MLSVFRKQTASPEDIEYYICQKEMMKDLCRSHQDVERIIGELYLSLLRKLFGCLCVQKVV